MNGIITKKRLLMQKPQWLNKKINLAHCHQLKKSLRKFRVHTVCEEALCPNISECFNQSVATFLILGTSCTRKCKFCAVDKIKPKAVDYNEPLKIKKAVKELNLSYVVITSVTRDDLADGGAQIFCDTVKEIKSLNKNIKVEILIPDFAGNISAIKKIAQLSADVISHNVETVPSLYAKIRTGANYQRSLMVLNSLKVLNKSIFTKSGLMLGLGEEIPQVLEVLRDLRKANCDFLTLGQYLPPSLGHYPVKNYISPEKFNALAKEAYQLGFKQVKSSAFTRSSYLAHTFLRGL